MGLNTDYGEDANYLSHIQTCDDFLDTLGCHFLEWRRVLKERGHAAVVVSDFRHKRRCYMFHADIADRMMQAGFIIQGLINIVQCGQRLYWNSGCLQVESCTPVFKEGPS